VDDEHLGGLVAAIAPGPPGDAAVGLVTVRPDLVGDIGSVGIEYQVVLRIGVQARGEDIALHIDVQRIVGVGAAGDAKLVVAVADAGIAPAIVGNVIAVGLVEVADALEPTLRAVIGTEHAIEVGDGAQWDAARLDAQRCVVGTRLAALAAVVLVIGGV